MKVFEFISEVIGWVLIALSPTAFGAIAGGLCYGYLPAPFGAILGIACLAIGFVLGAILATRQWRGAGTVHFLSRISSSSNHGQ